MDDTIFRRMIQNIMKGSEVGVLYDLPPKSIEKIHKMMFGSCPPDILATMIPKEKK